MAKTMQTRTKPSHFIFECEDDGIEVGVVRGGSVVVAGGRIGPRGHGAAMHSVMPRRQKALKVCFRCPSVAAFHGSKRREPLALLGANGMGAANVLVPVVLKRRFEFVVLVLGDTATRKGLAAELFNA